MRWWVHRQQQILPKFVTLCVWALDFATLAQLLNSITCNPKLRHFSSFPLSVKPCRVWCTPYILLFPDDWGIRWKPLHLCAGAHPAFRREIPPTKTLRPRSFANLYCSSFSDVQRLCWFSDAGSFFENDERCLFVYTHNIVCRM